MLPTELSTIWLIAAGFLTVFCGACVVWLVQLAQYCRSAVEFVENQNKRAVSLRRIADLETTCTELLDSYNSLLDSHKKLRSRIGMRNIRKSRENGADLTPMSSDADKSAYKATLRAKLRSTGQLR